MKHFSELTKLFGEPGHNSLNYGKAIVAGWGYTYNFTADDSVTIAATPKLQKLEVPTIKRQECVQRYKNLGADLSEYIRYTFGMPHVYQNKMYLGLKKTFVQEGRKKKTVVQ